MRAALRFTSAFLIPKISVLPNAVPAEAGDYFIARYFLTPPCVALTGM